MIKHLILLKILNVRNNQRRRTMVHKYFRKKSAGTYAHTGTEINLEKQKLAKNYTIQMLENLKAMNYIQFLKITYGEQI